MKRIIAVILLVVLQVIAFSVPVSATVAAPDGLYLLNTYAFRNNYESGDMTFVFYYNAYYADTYPTEVSTDTLILRLMNGTTELGTVAPYPYYSNGYQRGVGIIYFSAAEVTAKSMVWESAYTPKIVPNPLVSWDSTPSAGTSAIDWDDATTMSDAQANLGDLIISLALQLKTYWGINLVEAADGLNYKLTVSSTTGSGVDYFLDVYPNLALIAPDIFPTKVEQPIYKTTTPVTTYAPDELPVDVTDTATLFHMSKGTLTTMVAMVAIILFSFYIVSKNPMLTRYIFLIDGVLIVFFTRLGAIIPVWATLVATVALFVIAYVVFYEKSNA
jgi:hypothetical protein